MPMFKVKWGENALILPSTVSPVEKLLRTDSVLAMITDSGPAAASNPFVEAILSKELVEGGSSAAGHGEGNRRSLLSPAIAWKPRA